VKLSHSLCYCAHPFFIEWVATYSFFARAVDGLRLGRGRGGGGVNHIAQSVVGPLGPGGRSMVYNTVPYIYILTNSYLTCFLGKIFLACHGVWPLAQMA
jgi:hypothetical protein